MFERLLKRERNSRKEAERLLDQKSVELYDTNQRLRALADMLEHRVEERTAELQAALLRAESGDRAKSTFLANMSHEIRTPLNGICGMARILRSASLDHEALEQVRGIQISADSLLHVLNDILDFSKVEAGQLDIEEVDFDVAQVIDSAFTVLQARAAEKSLRFDFIYPEADLPLLRGDPSRLNEILLNLLGNSIKFTNAGSVALTARVAAREANSVVVQIIIQDSGIGMSEEEMSHIFEPFTQADASISRRFGGSGLGLAICKDLTQLMGGSLSVSSELGSGSEFTVGLPCQLSEEASGQPSSLDSNRSAYRLFIVTPSECFYRMCHSILAYGGLDLERVESAAEAVKCLGDGHGVLLVDRSLQPAFTPSLDQDIIEPLPSSLRRLLISEAVPPNSVETAEVVTYPISRYKLLSTVFDLLEIRLPGFLFQRYEEGSFDEVDLSGLRVLVAEDNKINQKVARMTIERFGATVDLAADGREVLELLDRFEYDLILMDIRMPVMDGVEACLALRAKGVDIPVYALTADAIKGDRERFLRAGMNGYLSKPLAEGDLVDILLKNHSRPARAEVDTSDAADVTVSADVSDSADLFYLEAAKADVLKLNAFYAVLSGNQEIALELLEEFTGYAQEYFDEAEAAFISGSWDDARSCFHKLAGSAATVCANQVRAYCLGMERSLMEDPPDVETCGHYLPEGRDALRNLREKINQLLKDR